MAKVVARDSSNNDEIKRCHKVDGCVMSLWLNMYNIVLLSDYQHASESAASGHVHVIGRSYSETSQDSATELTRHIAMS